VIPGVTLIIGRIVGTPDGVNSAVTLGEGSGGWVLCGAWVALTFGLTVGTTGCCGWQAAINAIRQDNTQGTNRERQRRGVKVKAASGMVICRAM
jgi:hypothetical protein